MIRALVIAVLLLAGCAPKNAFVGTWKLVSSSRPVMTDHITIDSSSIEYYNRDGSRPTFAYSIVNDHEALMQEPGMVNKIELTGQNTLRTSDPDSVFERV